MLARVHLRTIPEIRCASRPVFLTTARATFATLCSASLTFPRIATTFWPSCAFTIVHTAPPVCLIHIGHPILYIGSSECSSRPISIPRRKLVAGNSSSSSHPSGVGLSSLSKAAAIIMPGGNMPGGPAHFDMVSGLVTRPSVHPSNTKSERSSSNECACAVSTSFYTHTDLHWQAFHQFLRLCLVRTSL